MPFIGPLKVRECRLPRSGDAQGGGRTPHASFRRRSRPLGQAYAPSEASGILFTKKSNILILFLEFVLQDKDNNQSND